MRPEDIAEVCHEANRGLQRVQLAADTGVPVAAPWADLDDDETRASVISGVRGVLDGNTPEESHEAWCAFKRAHGWTYGPVKDAAALTHPCLIDYADLPEEQRAKDELFVAIVDALGDVQAPPPDLTGRHPGVVELLRWLTPNPHLTGAAAVVANGFHVFARVLVVNLDDGPELTTGLRKLLEAGTPTRGGCGPA